MVRRQEVVESVQRLEPEDVGVRYVPPAALPGEEADALEHALYAKELAVRVLRGARGEELPLSAADFDFQRPRKVQLKRLARICDSDYGIKFVVHRTVSRIIAFSGQVNGSACFVQLMQPV